jgi:phosphate transport system substrate-binding protein
MLRAFILLLSLLASGSIVAQSGIGATFPKKIYIAWIKNYEKIERKSVSYIPAGSGEGIKSALKRKYDFAGSDIPLKKKYLEHHKLLQFPTVISGVVAAYNIPGIRDGELKLSSQNLARIFLQEITNWNDPQLKKDNPDLQLPDLPIQTVQRSDGSGTTRIFTEYLSEVFIDFKKRINAGKRVLWLGGTQVKGNSGVATHIKKTTGAIGYVVYAAAKTQNLSMAAIKNSSGNYVQPSLNTFREAAKNANWNMNNHFYLWLYNSPGSNAYPLTAATFILLPKESTKTNKAVADFFSWGFSTNAKAITENYFSPLPPNVIDTIKAYWLANGI